MTHSRLLAVLIEASAAVALIYDRTTNMALRAAIRMEGLSLLTRGDDVVVYASLDDQLREVLLGNRVGGARRCAVVLAPVAIALIYDGAAKDALTTLEWVIGDLVRAGDIVIRVVFVRGLESNIRHVLN